MDTMFEDLDPAARDNCQRTVDLLTSYLGPGSHPYLATGIDIDLDPSWAGHDIAVFYVGDDDDDGPVAEAALARLTHVPLDVFDFTLTTASHTGVPAMLVARLAD